MDLKEQFEAAVAGSKNLAAKPDNENLLKMYSLYKQAAEGDVTGDRPGGFDFKAIAKFDAWAGQKGKDADTCMKEYIALIESLK